VIRFHPDRPDEPSEHDADRQRIGIDDAAGDRRSDDGAEHQEGDEVEDRRPHDRQPWCQHPRRDDRGDRVGRVVEAVDEVEDERDRDDRNDGEGLHRFRRA
jgi:hypothetical protein